MRPESVISTVIDALNLNILSELQNNARLTFSELGRKVGLSLPAVAERVRRLQDAGIIVGYRAELDADKLGYPITAFVRLRSTRQNYSRFKSALTGMAEVLECHHTTGEDSFTIKLVAASVPDLEQLIGKLSAFGETRTSIVLSTVLARPAGPNLGK